MASFFLKQSDTAPAIRYTVLDENDIPIDLTGATIAFYMQEISNGVEKINGGAAVVIDGPNGVVEYQWVAGDTSEANMYLAEFVITFPGGLTRTSPDPGYIHIIVTPSVRTDTPLP